MGRKPKNEDAAAGLVTIVWDAKVLVRDLSTLWQSNIAMENGPFEDVFPIENGDFPWLC